MGKKKKSSIVPHASAATTDKRIGDVGKKPAKKPKKTKLDQKAVFDKAREATDQMNAARDDVNRAMMVAEQLNRSLANFEDRVQETKEALAAKQIEIKLLNDTYEDSRRYQCQVTTESHPAALTTTLRLNFGAG